MDIQSFKYYVFYDLETTGMNPAFDQILQFAAVKTDLDLNEIERYQYRLELRSDVIPHPAALLVNRLSIDSILKGDKEYEAALKMRSVLSSPDTINIGYNTISFDDEFMRFVYDRNLLNPYSNQNNQTNCVRMDVMPITILYFLYHKDALRWPEINGRPNLKLENLNDLNGLAEGMAHDAVVDVLATIELARRFKHANPDMWNYLCQGFNRGVDLKRIDSLDKIVLSENLKCEKGIFIRNRFGYKNNCMSLCIKVASQDEMNRSFWLRLDTKDFNSINSKEILFELEKSTVRRKNGVPDFILPINKKYNASSSKKNDLYNSNLNWIKDNPNYIEELSEKLLNKVYDDRTVDIDASLYTREIGSFFFDKKRREVCEKFHSIDNINDKNDFVKNIPFEDVRDVAIRIMGRNYYDLSSSYIKSKFDEYTLSIKEEVHYDYAGAKRNTCENSLSAIRKRLDDISDLDSEQVQILESFEKYLLNKD